MTVLILGEAVIFTVSQGSNPYFFTDLMIDFLYHMLYDKIANYGDAYAKTMSVCTGILPIL